MANSNSKTTHLLATRWKRGTSGNPAGKPVGTKNLSTWIRDMLEDEGFRADFSDGTRIKGAPVRAIVGALIVRALEGDLRAVDMLARYGYGTKLDLTTQDKPLPAPIYGGLSSQIDVSNG